MQKFYIVFRFLLKKTHKKFFLNSTYEGSLNTKILLIMKNSFFFLLSNLKFEENFHPSPFPVFVAKIEFCRTIPYLCMKTFPICWWWWS